MKARSIARELALLGISQLTDKSSSRQIDPVLAQGSPPSPQTLNAFLTKALTTLSADAQEILDTAAGELQRSERLILESETRTVDGDEVRSRIQPAVPLVQSAINQTGDTLDLLMFTEQGDEHHTIAARNSLEAATDHLQQADRLIHEHERRAATIEAAREQLQLATATVQSAIADLKKALTPEQFSKHIDRLEIRSYAQDLLAQWIQHRPILDEQLDEAMEKWNIRRLARVDRDILRLAMVEILYLDVPKRVAIDEAIELAKRYSDEDGYRFINGVLRRVTDRLATGTSSSTAPSASNASPPENSLPENSPPENLPPENLPPESEATPSSQETPLL